MNNTTPTIKQMQALERSLSKRRGLRQVLDEIRNAHETDDPPENPDSDRWIESEYPIIIEIMHEAVTAVLEAM